jgi:hypothetical protein
MDYKQHNEYLSKYLDKHKTQHTLRPAVSLNSRGDGQSHGVKPTTLRLQNTGKSLSTANDSHRHEQESSMATKGSLQRAQTALVQLDSNRPAGCRQSAATNMSHSNERLQNRSKSSLGSTDISAQHFSMASSQRADGVRLYSSPSRSTGGFQMQRMKEDSTKDGLRSDTGNKLMLSSREKTELKSLSSSSNRTRAPMLYAGRKRDCRLSISSLPDELLMKVFNYLTPGDLLSCAAVSKYWQNIANDNVLWYRMYLRYCAGGKRKKGTLSIADQPPSYWKQQCLCRNDELRPVRIVRQLKRLNPFTGLPRDTQNILEKMTLRWALVLVTGDGKEQTIAFHNDLCYFSMVVCVRWYPLEFKTNEVRRLRVYAVRPAFFDHSGKPLLNSPCRRSLVADINFSLADFVMTHKPVGEDKLLGLYAAEAGLSFGIWKEGNGLAFVAISLHYHQLVQRCIMGDHSRMFVPEVSCVPHDDVDSKYGLHGYSCTLELRNLRNSLWTQQFNNVFSQTGSTVSGWVKFSLIDPERSYERSSLNKKILMPWKTTVFSGKIPNTCIVDCTVLDEHENPMWCTSFVTVVQKHQNTNLRYEYDGDDLYQLYVVEPEYGAIDAVLIWEETTSQFFMTSLQLHLHVAFINRWFSTRH